MKKAVMVGSFDPFTIGHLDMLITASGLFDEVTVGVLVNVNKKCVFSPQERMAFIERIIGYRHINNAKVTAFSGLAVDFAKMCGANFLVRGVRNSADLDTELAMVEINRKLCPDIETVIIPAKAELVSVSSGAVREIAMFGGDIKPYLPEEIYNDVNIELTERIGTN